ncbi:hypothetical protein O5964_31405, partial [Escherichia coli]|nr:hypothetical protein [Escherichia coli]
HDNYLEFQQVLSDIGEALEARVALNGWCDLAHINEGIKKSSNMCG